MKNLKTILVLAAFGIAACQNKQVKLEGSSANNSKAAVADSSKLIVAGKQIGKIYLGQDASALSDLLGKPNAGDAAMGKAWGIWYDHANQAIETYAVYTTYRDSTMQAKEVRQIRTGSSLYKLENGLGVGSAFAQLKQAYPALQKLNAYLNQKTKDTLFIYDEMKQGIAFELVANKCTGVTVHPAQQKSNESCLTYYPDWKLIN